MGAARSTRSINALTGIHVPSLTWFLEGAEQEIDWNLQKMHLQFLVESGVDGVVIAGTNGEAVTLSRDEKAKLVQMTRQVAIDAGRAALPIGVGTSGQCTRDVMAETRLAASAGGDYALVLTPSYFHFAMDTDAIAAFFEEVAEASPLPLVIYNFPGVAAGIDLDSDLLIRLGKCPNIAGVKLTCGGIAKVARIAATYEPDQFFALAGQSDWLVPALSVGGTGCITGVANLFPKVCLSIYNLYGSGEVGRARELQLQLAKMETGFGKGGINGTKWVVAGLRGYAEGSWHCRRPYPQFTSAELQRWVLETVQPLVEVEAKLVKRAVQN
ncbi:dihydrodipicolinate synthetase family protein [Cordyceps fumosorosea ARSEF 2679]|uniref:Dihydrodipicolinate synthetase family protein n=1 Tax=Cordyceps fumosorosea (strain ARSEF 2679) TaxID=1081104 RepID=A0A167LQ86_CORFA|nr:dihydrodipicolinate synthetase family protein [Cordyceps fumosorosea ARSEF 2679]OAA53364.1 dihydrodipicolinate synthetase family protein [Cordyceps fumosorosea ARSEF 2679]